MNELNKEEGTVKLTYEESVELIAKANVFNPNQFLEAYEYFLDENNKLPEDVKAKVLENISDYAKVEKDYEERIEYFKRIYKEEDIEYFYYHMGIELSEIKRILPLFSLENIFNISYEEDDIYSILWEDPDIDISIFTSDIVGKIRQLGRNKDYDSVLNYRKKCNDLLSYFSTVIEINVENPFLKDMKENGIKKDNVSSGVKLGRLINSLNIKAIDYELVDYLYRRFEIEEEGSF